MAKFQSSGLVIIILLNSCFNSSNQNNKNLSSDSTSVGDKYKTADSSAPNSYFRIGSDSIPVLPFEIEISLSSKAKERITDGKETMIVSADFEGTPKPNSHPKLEEDGSFFVAIAKKEVLSGQVVRFDSVRFSRAIYDELADKDIQVNVEVYSGRKSSPDNLLACDPLFNKISNIVNKRSTIKGKLIYGDD